MFGSTTHSSVSMSRRAARTTVSRVAALAALAACLLAMTSGTPAADASVRWGDTNISEARFFCSPGQITIRATIYTYNGYNATNGFQYTVYNWLTGKWSSYSSWQNMPQTLVLSVPRGGNLSIYVHYYHRNTTDGRMVEWYEYAETFTNGVNSMGTGGLGGRCYT